MSPLLTRGLTEALLRAPSVTEVVCPDCRALVHRDAWPSHRDQCPAKTLHPATVIHDRP